MNHLFLRLIIVTIVAIPANIMFGQEITPMVVRINYSCLNFEVINDYEQRSISFADLLNERGMNELKSLTGVYSNIAQYEMVKIFPNLTTNDTISVSRSGERISIPPFWATFQMQVPQNVDYFRFMEALNNQSRLIDYAHPEFHIEPTSVPNDTLYYKQFSLNEAIPNADINVEEAWDIETGEPFIKVAVHDNGIDSAHLDLDVVFGAAYDGADYPEDNWGVLGYHGTPVAGIIGAKRNNETGISGIAGGDGTDSSGVSLIDTKYSFGQNVSVSYFMAAVVDAARSPGTYWDYPDGMNPGDSDYYNHAPGFGVHIGNHSYVIRTDLPQVIVGGKIQDDNNVTVVSDCQICREAFLFSLRNGVINVVARGNSGSASPSLNPQYIVDLFPQQLPDSWIISVGASSYDGTTVQDGINQSPQEATINYYSLYGGNMDLIAPGSDSIVYSTKADATNHNLYTKFNGTSAAAPHVSGVVGLLLSHYNKQCYNNRNLSIEDVEYILENSTVNPDGLSHQYTNLYGWGRLDAGAALKMIEHPVKQIVHPNILISSNSVQIDTIALGYGEALTALDWGPISTPWPMERNREYQVVRVLMENTYDISMFTSPTTQILDYWARPSVSNSCAYFRDTIWIEEFFVPQNSSFVDTTYDFDKFDLEPFDTIVDFNPLNGAVKTQGYYYHFINKYDNPVPPDINIPSTWSPDPLVIVSSENYWYPIDPFTDTAKLLFSIYIQDTTLTGLYDYPCDLDNPLYDEDFQFIGIEEQELQNIQVYPNPFGQQLSVVFGNTQGEKILIVKDLNGKVLGEHTTLQDSYTLNMKDLSNGLYLLTCIAKGKSKTFKIVKL